MSEHQCHECGYTIYSTIDDLVNEVPPEGGKTPVYYHLECWSEAELRNDPKVIRRKRAEARRDRIRWRPWRAAFFDGLGIAVGIGIIFIIAQALKMGGY